MTAAAAIAGCVLVGLVAPQAARAEDSTSWTATLLAGALTPVAVATDSAGDVFVAGKYDGQVHEFSPSGTPDAAFTTLGEGLNQISALAVSGGSVYVAERTGGGLGTGTVVKLNASTGALQSGFSAAAADLAGPQGLAVNGSGVWVTTEDSRAVVMLSPTSGSVESGFSVDVTTNAVDPVGLAVDTTGDLYIANAACGTAAGPVIKVTSATGAVVPAFSSSGDNIGLGQGVASDTDGDILVSTGTCSVASKGVDTLDPTTGAVVGHLLQSDLGLATGPGDVAYLFSETSPGITRYDIATDAADTSFLAAADPLGLPVSVTADQSGEVYVADSAAAGIDKFDGTSGAQQIFGNTHDVVVPNAVEANGKNVYLAGSPNNRVVELNNTGSAVGASSPAIDLTNPALIAVADATHLFETVTDSSRIVERDPTVGTVYSGFSVAGDGLSNIAGITTDNAGHVFVTETCPTNEIVELDATTGAVLQIFAAAGAGGIQCPRAVAADDAGHLFVVGLNQALDAEVVELSTSDGSVVSSFDAQTVTGGLNVGGSLAVTSGDRVFLTGSSGLVRVDLTSAAAPAAPTITSVVPGQTSANVSWTPAGSGGSAVTGYTATAEPGGSHCTVAAPATSCTISGLAADTTYSITVTATNAIGTSPASGSVSVTTTAPKKVTVTVVRNGTGTGTVTGPGISCPSTCSSSFAVGTTVSLTATPALNSTFTGWTGACSGRAVCTITPSAATTVTATFGKIAAPNTKLVSTSIKAAKGTATFTFSSTGNATGYQCAVAKTGTTLKYQSCSSPVTYQKLAKGHYRFQVRAVGPGGTDPSPAGATFTI